MFQNLHTLRQQIECRVKPFRLINNLLSQQFINKLSPVPFTASFAYPVCFQPVMSEITDFLVIASEHNIDNMHRSEPLLSAYNGR